ncbi:MAG: prepilin-type N-terminal cleavage/methylation domain-containing protein [Pirellulales bacterium]|nr:prepilin-type N-terminal cleavage/methylation domain-containing protein [Pirellulales bacterium]
MTLIEMLVGMAITLVMMAAVVTLFANIGEGVRNRRASMEMGGQLRVARARLFKDLAGATCPAVTWQEPGSDNGYIELIEGSATDLESGLLTDGIPENGELDYTVSLVPGSNLLPLPAGAVTDGRALGDYDDILALTVRSSGEPFTGRGPGNEVIQSDLAEVVWYSVENPADGSLGEPGMRTVYRRVLLIAPWIMIPDNPTPNNFFQELDISAHHDGLRWVPNSLGDLTKREFRCYRSRDSLFPHYLASGGIGHTSPPNVQFIRAAGDTLTVNATAVPLLKSGRVETYQVTEGGEYERLPTILVNGATARPIMRQISTDPPIWEVAHLVTGPVPLAFEREGEDVVLNDVLAFDVRVFDPGAPLFLYNDVLVEPLSTATFETVIEDGTLSGFGAFVDLGWDQSGDYYYGDYPAASVPLFQAERPAGWHPRAPLNGLPSVYDTWSLHYESDGVDQDDASDSGSGIDQGTNGLDDDVDGSGAFNGTDDMGERETSPPYDVPLPGMQVKIRIYERDTRQIREATVTKDF